MSAPTGMHEHRPSWKTLYERDLDLLLLDLLHSSPAFRAQLLGTVAADAPVDDPDAGFLGAWHSVTGPLGESDLEAAWRTRDGSRFVLLVEDKLDAQCQPEQALRYRRRADEYLAAGRATRARTLLVAPAAYPARLPDDTAPFEAHLAVETVAAWCEGGVVGERGAYAARFLRHAVDRLADRGRRAAGAGIVPAPGASGDDWRASPAGGKPRFPEVYALLAEELARRAGPLSISSSIPGEWVYFGWPGRGGPRCATASATTGRSSC